MPIGMRRWHYKRLVKAKEEEKKDRAPEEGQVDLDEEALLE